MAEMTERETKLAIAGLHRLMSDAYQYADACAQDKEGKWSTPGDVERFLQDARDAGALIQKLRASDVQGTAPQP